MQLKSFKKSQIAFVLGVTWALGLDYQVKKYFSIMKMIYHLISS